MQLEQRRQAMLQLHLTDRQFYCIQRCNLYSRFDCMIPAGVFWFQLRPNCRAKICTKRCSIVAVGTLDLFQDRNLDAFGSMFFVLHHVVTTQVASTCLIARYGAHFIKYDDNFGYGKSIVLFLHLLTSRGCFCQRTLFYEQRVRWLTIDLHHILNDNQRIICMRVSG